MPRGLAQFGVAKGPTLALWRRGKRVRHVIETKGHCDQGRLVRRGCAAGRARGRRRNPAGHEGHCSEGALTSAAFRFVQTGAYESLSEAVERDVKDDLMRHDRERVLTAELRDRQFTRGLESAIAARKVKLSANVHTAVD